MFSICIRQLSLVSSSNPKNLVLGDGLIWTLLIIRFKRGSGDRDLVKIISTVLRAFISSIMFLKLATKESHIF